MSHIQRQEIVPMSMADKRLDQIATSLFPEYSRNRLQNWIKSGHLLVDEKPYRASVRLHGGERLVLDVEVEDLKAQPEPIDLDIVYEDEDLLVINKRADLVVHPGAGNFSGTILNGLLYHEDSLSTVPGGGLVHRLDKGTTGLMVVAKTLESQSNLVGQLQARTVKREYEAIVYGKPRTPGKVDAPIGRHRTQRTKMAVRNGGRPAMTHYRITRLFVAHSHLELNLETGRTHQIRVHMQHLGFPLVGDDTYGGHKRRLLNAEVWEQDEIDNFGRPALHAKKLSLIHPGSNKEIMWEAETPDDFTTLLRNLYAHQARTQSMGSR